MYQSVADRLIREAIERGEFDDLPGAGKPIPGAGRQYDPDWWARSFIERERSDERRRAAFERIEARLGAVWALTSESAVRRTVERLNAEIAELEDGSQRFEPFDVEDVVRAWKHMVQVRGRRRSRS